MKLLYDLNIYPQFETVPKYPQAHHSLSGTNKTGTERHYISQADTTLHPAETTIIMLHLVTHDYHI
jgi:hypothetical protein